MERPFSLRLLPYKGEMEESFCRGKKVFDRNAFCDTIYGKRREGERG